VVTPVGFETVSSIGNLTTQNTTSKN
jgi:hypothetical protein